MSTMEAFDELHVRKAQLILECNATINITQQVIAKSLRLSREVKILLGDSKPEHQKYGNSTRKV